MKRYCLTCLIAIGTVSGFLACSRSERVETDTWHLPKPSFVTKKDIFEVKRFPLDGNTSHALNSDGEILFENLTDVDSVKIQVQSQCTLNGEIYRRDRTLTGVNRVPLLEIISEKLWLRNDIQVLNHTKCDFNFLGTNSNQSSHSIKINTMMLSHLPNAEVIKVVSNVMHTPDTKIPDFPFTIIESKTNSPRDAYLICDHFRSRVTAAANQMLDPLLNDLVFGEVDPVFKINDERKSHHLQNCRFFTFSAGSFSSPNLTEAPSEIQVSAEFKAQFPISTELGLEMGRHFSEQNPTDPLVNFKDLDFAVLHIHNNSPATSAYRFPIDLANSKLLMNLSLQTHKSNTIYLHDEVTTQLRWRLEGAETVDATGNSFTVPPGQSAKIIGRIVTDLRCIQWNFGRTPITHDDITLGLNYSLNVPIQVEQYLNFNPETGKLNGPTLDLVTSKNIPFSKGHIPAPLADQVNGLVNANQVKKGPRDARSLEIGCFVGPHPGVIFR